MKCPFCGENMEYGYVQSARKIFFTPQRHALFFEACDEDEQTLSAHNFTSPTCEAFRCARCEKIIIDYSSDETPKTKNCLYDFFFRRTK